MNPSLHPSRGLSLLILLTGFLALPGFAAFGTPDPPEKPALDLKAEGLPALEQAVGDETQSGQARYLAARALVAIAPERAPALLASGPDPARAAVIDQLGDAGIPELDENLGKMLASPGPYQATLTGDALARLQLSREYQDHWAGVRDWSDRLAFLLDRLGEMYTIAPPPAQPSLRDDPVGRWLQRALTELAAEDLPELKAALEERIARGAVNATLAERTLRAISP